MTATGEPPLCMAVSVLFALRNAIQHARNDAGESDWFQMGKLYFLEMDAMLIIFILNLFMIICILRRTRYYRQAAENVINQSRTFPVLSLSFYTFIPISIPSISYIYSFYTCITCQVKRVSNVHTN